MNRKQQVLLRLKPKVKAFGFNKKELQSVAAHIADNLNSEEDASDEDVNAEIDASIDAVLPFLQFGQSYANRLCEELRKKDNELEDSEEDLDEPTSGSSHKPTTKEQTENTDIAKLLKAVEILTGEIATLKGEKVADSRKSRLEAILKDTGAFGTRTLKSFSKMKFESDEDFEDFFADVQEDLKTLNQERADNGLKALGAPVDAPDKGRGEQTQVITDAEIKDIVGALG